VLIVTLSIDKKHDCNYYLCPCPPYIRSV